MHKNSSHVTVENLWLSAVRLVMYPLTDAVDDCGILQNCSYSAAANQIGLHIPKKSAFYNLQSHHEQIKRVYPMISDKETYPAMFVLPMWWRKETSSKSIHVIC